MTSAFAGSLPGTKPGRPSYPPPVPVGTPVDPGGADSATRAINRQRQVADLYTSWRAAHSTDIAPDVLKANAGAFSVSDAALTLPEVLAGVKAEADEATRKTNELISGTRVGDDVASQLQAQRIWARAQRNLDAIKDPTKLIAAAQNLIANADDAAIPVLTEELGEYLESRSAPTGWLPQALAAKIPGLADAAANATVLTKQHAILQHNHRALTSAIQKDIAAPELLDPAIATADQYVDYSG